MFKFTFSITYFTGEKPKTQFSNINMNIPLIAKYGYPESFYVVMTC